MTVNPAHTCARNFGKSLSPLLLTVSDVDVVKPTETRNSKATWEEPRRHPSRQKVTTSQSSKWLQWDAPCTFTPETAPDPLRRSPPYLIHQ